MRIGLLGPADDDPALARKAAEFLLGAPDVEQVVYLGADAAIEKAAEAWSRELMGGASDEESFLMRAYELSRTGSAAQIHDFLARDAAAQRLEKLRYLPEPPTRAVEMFEDKVILFVHDKAQLDAEDIANAYLVVYGRSKSMALNHFGPRTFFAPGPLKTGHVACLERRGDNQLVIAQIDFYSGEVVSCTPLSAGRSKVVVLS